MSFLSDYKLLILSRLFAGILGGILAVTNLNYLILMSNDNRKKRNTATLLSTFPLALSLGIPSILILTNEGGWRLGFQLIGGGFLIIGILFIPVLSKINSPVQFSPIPQPSKLNTQYKINNTLFISVGIIFSAVLGTFIISTQFPVMLITNLNISNKLLSLCYLCGGTGSFVVLRWYGIKINQNNVANIINSLSLIMVITITSGFKTDLTPIALAAFILFIISSSARTLILITELVSSLPPVERTRIISIQNFIQHLAVGIGGAVGSMLITTGRDYPLDFTSLTQVAIIVTIAVPVLWKIKYSNRQKSRGLRQK